MIKNIAFRFFQFVLVFYIFMAVNMAVTSILSGAMFKSADWLEQKSLGLSSDPAYQFIAGTGIRILKMGAECGMAIRGATENRIRTLIR